MPLFTSFNESSIGVFVQEGTFGGNTGSITPFNKVFMFSYCDPTAEDLTFQPVSVQTAQEALAVVRGTNVSFTPSTAWSAAVDAYFLNIRRELWIVPIVADAVDPDAPFVAALNALEDDDDIRLGIYAAPDVEGEDAADQATIYAALLSLAEVRYSQLFVSVAGESEKTALSLTSTNGHVFFFTASTATDSADREVSPAVLAAAAAMRRITSEGVRQPGFGVKAFIRGVTLDKYTKAQIGALLDDDINPIGVFKGVGQVLGYNTGATESLFEAGTVRQVLNVLGASVEDALQQFVGESIDGQDVLFGDVRRVVVGICQQLWNEGSLFGATPEDAFFVQCDRSNNPDFTLENRELRVDVYAAPSPYAERVLVGIFRTAIGSVPQQA